MKHSLIIAALLAFALSAVGSTGAMAKSCRDDHGKFIKCAPVVVKHCRDMKTKKFAKCGMPGTEPVPMAADHK